MTVKDLNPLGVSEVISQLLPESDMNGETHPVCINGRWLFADSAVSFWIG